MRAGIAVDDWKLPVFRRRLTEAGFEYEDGGPLLSGNTLLVVITDRTLDRMVELQHVIIDAQAECARSKKK